MDYSKMGSEKAKEMIKGKRVIVVGYLKSALDVAAECAETNGTEYANSFTSVKETSNAFLLAKLAIHAILFVDIPHLLQFV